MLGFLSVANVRIFKPVVEHGEGDMHGYGRKRSLRRNVRGQLHGKQTAECGAVRIPTRLSTAMVFDSLEQGKL